MVSVKNRHGFTLLELLVVVAIIGIIAAIAVSQYQTYRVRAFNATAQTDARNFMTAQEAYYADNQRYTDDINVLPGVDGASDGVTYQLYNSFGPLDVYGVLTYHEQGTLTYCFISDEDDQLRAEDGAPSPLAVCIF